MKATKEPKASRITEEYICASFCARFYGWSKEKQAAQIMALQTVYRCQNGGAAVQDAPPVGDDAPLLDGHVEEK